MGARLRVARRRQAGLQAFLAAGWSGRGLTRGGVACPRLATLAIGRF